VVAQKLGERLGHSLVVDNRPGATGNIGHEMVARAQPDGYTMLLTAPNLVTSPSLFAQVGFDPLRDFAPIAQLTLSPNVWLVHPSFPVPHRRGTSGVRCSITTTPFAGDDTCNCKHQPHIRACPQWSRAMQTIRAGLHFGRQCSEPSWLRSGAPTWTELWWGAAAWRLH
jgi:hypothetical protein